MRGKRAKELRRKALEIGVEQHILIWRRYEQRGPFKKKVFMIDPKTRRPALDKDGKPKIVTVLHWGRVNVGVRAIYLALKRGHKIARRNGTNDSSSSYQKAA